MISQVVQQAWREHNGRWWLVQGGSEIAQVWRDGERWRGRVGGTDAVEMGISFPGQTDAMAAISVAAERRVTSMLSEAALDVLRDAGLLT